MAIIYVKDPDGVIHLLNNIQGTGEFTWCDRDSSGADDETTQTFQGVFSDGPANCRQCREAVNYMRARLKGVKFARRRLFDGGPQFAERAADMRGRR